MDPPLNVPQLTTDRLLLRGFRESDLDAYAAMMADPEVTRFLSDGKPLARADAWRQMAWFAGHWALRGFGLWAVEERSTGALVGRIGCFEPEGWPGFEVGYTLARPYWGRGYAREGARAALDYARHVLGKSEIISLIRPDNAGSIRVAQALGATRTGEVEFFGSPTSVYSYPPPDDARPVTREDPSTRDGSVSKPAEA
jgi:RimJ/RimL family protein N-acetyltransferase